MLLLLLWQAAVYLSAVRTSAWSYLESRAPGRAVMRPTFRSLGHALGRFVPERRAAGWVAASMALFGGLLYLGLTRAPVGERIMRADPLRQFVGDRSLVVPSAAELAGAILVLEADAARRGDVERALRLWHPDGVIVDANFTPDAPDDDRVWRGSAELRERYLREFQERRYRRLVHGNLRIAVAGDSAEIVNDLDAVFEAAGQIRAVTLPQSDRWVLRLTNGEWRLVRLEVNRAGRPPGPNRPDLREAPGRVPV
jgi:ketosteroid isomerase-like protein